MKGRRLFILILWFIWSKELDCRRKLVLFPGWQLMPDYDRVWVKFKHIKKFKMY